MIEAVYLGVGIVAFFLVNAIYMSWRGSRYRKEEAERTNPLGGK